MIRFYSHGMDEVRRQQVYTDQNGVLRLTARQRRRMIKKHMHLASMSRKINPEIFGGP